jgi:cellulose synthase/poly-beta-1,6-N-acetylglucosamine synthase-like glycosyltransferase
MKRSVSILISTYNGRLKLESTLLALSQLDRLNIDLLQLVVVDNASSDHTAEFVKNFWLQLETPFELILLEETNPGKLYAQELGLQNCKGDFVLICDDDNSLNIDYLQVGLNYFEKNPVIGVLGGRGVAVSTVPIPIWFKEFEYYFACAPQASETGNVMPTRNVVYGAGMWIRKSVYLKAKELGFQFILGSRTGSKLTTGGEDSELCWSIKLLGFEIWYIDEMQFYHHLPPDRLTLAYKARLLDGLKINGPLGWIYLRIWKNNITEEVSNFWLKELIYSLLDYLRALGRSKSSELRKLLKINILFYLKYRSEFDNKFNQVIRFRNKCLEDISTK